MADPTFTICALFYGDYPALAKRLLVSLEPLFCDPRVVFRIGSNAISDAVRLEVTPALQKIQARGEANLEVVLDSRVNRFKYPVMRDLFGKAQLRSSFVMWFDDDSYITHEKPQRWLDLVEKAMENADMIGALYRMNTGLIGKQPEWVRSRPWYAGKPVALGHKSDFATGGWWTIRTEALTRWNWPDPEITHNGGDVMLGELCRQQGLRLVRFSDGVAINKAPRRGASHTPVGVKLPKEVS